LSVRIFQTSVGLVIKPVSCFARRMAVISLRERTTAWPSSVWRTRFDASEESSGPVMSSAAAAGAPAAPPAAVWRLTVICLPRYISSSLVALTTSYS
jgi:hypothetical protein